MIDKIAAKLREPLSESELVRLGTEVLSEKPRHVASKIFAVLNRDPSELLVTNSLALFRELALRSPSWVTLLRKSLDKKGRCPRPLVHSVRGLLSTEGDRFAARAPSVRQLLADLETVIEERTMQTYVSGVQVKRTTTFFRSGKLRATVPMTRELSDIVRMEAVATLLNEIPANTDELQLDFAEVEHVYVVGLAAIAAWCRRKDIRPEVINASDATLKYLDTIGFTTASRGGISPYNETDPGFAMAFEEIFSDSQPENVASKLVTIIDSQT